MKPLRVVIASRGIHSRAFVIFGCVVLVIAMGAAIIWWRHQPDAQQANAAKQRTLQADLSDAVSHDQNQQVITYASQLISGQKAGIFTLRNAALSTYYLEQGAAMMNLNEYAKASSAFQNGASLGGANKKAALQGELLAGYRSGQRQQLIPILQQLSVLAAQHPDPLGGVSSSYYEQQIQALQNNQALQL